MSREQEFESICQRLSGSIAYESRDSVVAHGDSLEALQALPTDSISLVLTDPPYHSTKKANISGDTDFQEDEHFLEWMEEYAKEWKRVLKMSGTLYLFCASEMAARLEVAFSKYFKPINHIVWTKPNEPGYDGWKGKMRKESMRKWYPHSERILVFEHGTYGTYEAYRRSPQGQYLLDMRKASGLSMIQLTEFAGAYGNVNRGGAVANWEAGRNTPSREQYAKVKDALEATGNVPPLLDYEDLFRPLDVTKDVEFTDVWDFMSVRPFKDKHPAEKPQDMLMHIIAASSYPGDVVLDTFAGSGSTLVAARRLGRRSVGIELERRWVDRARADLDALVVGSEYEQPVRVHHARRTHEPLLLDRLFD